jgi:hypothetical protein
LRLKWQIVLPNVQCQIGSNELSAAEGGEIANGWHALSWAKGMVRLCRSATPFAEPHGVPPSLLIRDGNKKMGARIWPPFREI